MVIIDDLVKKISAFLSKFKREKLKEDNNAPGKNGNLPLDEQSFKKMIKGNP